MITLNWRDAGGGFEVRADDLPLWREGRFPKGVGWTMWIERRPPYCDRGRWKLDVDAPIDAQEGFPRYFFDLERAKLEAQEWVNVRKELRHADHTG